MRNLVIIQNESKEIEAKNWLLSSINSTLYPFSKLPNHAFMSNILIHLNGDDLIKLIFVSRAFSNIIKEFRMTKFGQQNFNQFIQSMLKVFAKKQDLELKEDMPPSEAILVIEQNINLRTNAITSTAFSKQSDVYEKALHILCSMENVSLSPCGVKFIRGLFILLCAASTYGLYYGNSSGKDDEDTLYYNITCGTIGGLTGLALINDLIQSLYLCFQKKTIREEQSQFSSLRTAYSTFNSDTSDSSINSSDYVALEP